MSQFLLFYYSYPQQCPVTEASLAKHSALLTSHNLLGRYRVAPLGVNGIVQGAPTSLANFVAAFTEYLKTNDLYIHDPDWKFGELRAGIPRESQSFKDLKVQRVKEIVSYTECGDQQPSRRRKHKPNRPPIPPSTAATADTPSDTPAPPPPPAPISRLSPSSWHALLSNPPPSAVLLDTRNLYESAIGLFTSPLMPTLRPTVRKFADLNQQYMSEIKEDIGGKHVFMYCTGGVRCDTMKEAMAAWKGPGGEQVASVNLLEGGICKYLEEFGQEEASAGVTGKQSGSSHFLGKNFVFDPRRYDPQISSSLPTVGVCVLCSRLHDDYDHGKGHNDGKETRCDKCRVLILLCEACKTEEGGAFCGGGGQECMGELRQKGMGGVIVDDDRSVRERVEKGKSMAQP